MPDLSPHELRAGCVLAEDVYNLDARLLFPAGTKLNDRKIETLMMWGVESVALHGSSVSEAAISIKNFSNSAKQDAELEIQRRFKLVKSSHPAVIAIREIAVLEAAKSSAPSAQQP